VHGTRESQERNGRSRRETPRRGESRTGRHTCKRHRSKDVHILDLIVKGNEGLLHAVQGLVDRAPDSFAPHATKFIKRALVEAAQSVRQTPRAPRDTEFGANSTVTRFLAVAPALA
jgi:hypothetical protein